MIELAAETAPGRRRSEPRARESVRHTRTVARSGLRIVDLLRPAAEEPHIEAAYEGSAIAHALFGTEPLDPAKMYDEYAAAAERLRRLSPILAACSTGSLPKAAA